ncbi:hypothetical protein GOP47_0002310 [Adiantum capillus-veneris]|uniref:RING-type E3 ubiquitin transferase n=1 Tax=Adiantum capillus-veneris TaxID=13818 RepID=A0A9D4ZR47_ADICA|nr:hypothetical protein GOP47_0002310 [Adiantum capillus-veneris]
MAGVRWGKFSGRSRGAGQGGKGGRKCEKSDSKESTKSKESECTRKKGFWRSRCMNILAAHISFDIKAQPNPSRKSLLDVQKCLDAKFSSLTIDHPISHCDTLQEAELKRRGECIEDVEQSVDKFECVKDGAVEIGCWEDPEVSAGKESGCMANAWLDGPAGKRNIGGNEACDIRCTKADYTEAGNHEKVEHQDCEKAAAYETAGGKDSSQCIDSKVVAFNAGVDSAEIQEVDYSVHYAGEQKFDDLAMKNSDARLQRVPNDFLCGISKRVMEDPVVVASGQTFERASIQAWLDEGNTHCPVTHKVLSHFQLIPNLTLKTLISSWFSSTSSHDLGLESAENSFTSCISSFSSCPSLMTCSDEKFVSCSSFSVSELLEDMELHSFSSGSSFPLPKLLLNTDLNTFSSSSISLHSSSSTEHLRDRRAHIHSLTPSSSESSLCWEQELCSSQEIEILDSIPSNNFIQGKSRFALPKNRSLHSKSKDRTSLSRKPSTYTVSRIDSLVSDLKSDYIDIKRNAAAELRLLAKHEDSNRMLITKAGAINPLIMLLRSVDESIQLDATTALLNLSLNHSLKEYLAKEGAVEAVVGVLRDGLSEGVKENAAVALAHLAACEANRSIIGSAGAIMLLTELLERGSARGKKDAAAALYRLSSVEENKRRMVRAGALRPLVGFMVNGGGKDGMVDKALAILRNLVSIEEGRVALVEEGGIISLLEVMEVGSERSRGLAVPILLQLCVHSSEHRSLVLQNDPLSLLMSISKTANPGLKLQVAEMIEVLIVDP